MKLRGCLGTPEEREERRKERRKQEILERDKAKEDFKKAQEEIKLLIVEIRNNKNQEELMDRLNTIKEIVDRKYKNTRKFFDKDYDDIIYLDGQVTVLKELIKKE